MDLQNLTHGMRTEGAICCLSSSSSPPMENEMNTTEVPGDRYEDFYETSQFINGIVLYPIIIIIGLTGNVLTFIVLSHRKMLTSTNVFLSALAVSDTIKLTNDTLYFVVTILLRRHKMAGNRMLGYMYPFSHYIFNQSVCVSSWLTVSVAVERYISVCHATRARVVCTINRAKVISALVFVVMSLIAVPSALRYMRTVHVDPLTNATEFDMDLSELGKNKRFMAGYTWTINLLRSIIPLFVLIILNTFIIQALQKERVKGKKMSARNRITLMLIVVIIVFIICVLPDAIMSTVFGFGYVDESSLVKGIREITDTLLSLNSAVNFMIYCLCSKCFRDVFVEIFCQKCACRYQFYQQVRLGQIATTAKPTLDPADKVEKEEAAPNDKDNSIRSSVADEGGGSNRVYLGSGPGSGSALIPESLNGPEREHDHAADSAIQSGANITTTTTQPAISSSPNQMVNHITVYDGPQTYL